MLSSSLFAASLWDFRLGDLRVFDGVAIVFLLSFFILRPDFDRTWISRRAYILPFVAITISYAILGYLNFHHRSSLAIGILALFCLQSGGYEELGKLGRVFKWIVYLHVAVWAIQYISFQCFGAIIDPQQLFGVNSRIIDNRGDSAFHHIRAAGLFQEPNSYCLNMFVVGTAALLPARDRILALVAVATMLLSESLWGIVAAFVLIALNEWNSSDSFARKCASVAATFVAVIVAFNAVLWLTKYSAETKPELYLRLSVLGSDLSVRYRYVAATNPKAPVCVDCGRRDAASKPQSLRPYPLLGNGLSTSQFINSIPANGVSFIWHSFGIIGLPLLILACVVMLLKLTMRDRFYIAGALVFAFTSYPLITYAILWLWIPSVVMCARLKDERVNLSKPLAAVGKD